MRVKSPSLMRAEYFFILRLHTAYDRLLVLRNAYRLTTKTTFLMN